MAFFREDWQIRFWTGLTIQDKQEVKHIPGEQSPEGTSHMKARLIMIKGQAAVYAVSCTGLYVNLMKPAEQGIINHILQMRN